MDPESPETKTVVSLVFFNQAAPDIKRKFQRVERLVEKSSRDLVTVAERVFSGKETAEEKQMRGQRQQTRDLAKILLAAMAKPQDHRRYLKQIASEGGGKGGPKDQELPHLGKSQYIYCKEISHWARECPKKKKPIQTMAIEEGTRSAEYGGQGLDPSWSPG